MSESDEPKAPADTVEPSEASPTEESASDDRDSVVPAGNRPHWVRGLSIFAVGAAIPFLIMCTDRHWPFSVPVGLIGCLIAAFGIFDALGSFDDPTERVTALADGSKLRPALLELGTAVAAWFVAQRLAVAGTLMLPILAAAVLITATFIWMVAATFRTFQALGAFRNDESGRPRPLVRRHGFWLIVLTTILYLPMLGSYSLSDPWETHYGEVAREMIARDDWISLWWAQDGWFWSKPILDFWVQGIFFSALGVKAMPDQMLAGIGAGRFPQPEWAARMPVFLLTVAATYFLYKGVAKVCGRRAGLLGGIVLTTMPYWYFIAHQSMTDMVYVAPLTAAMGLMLLGFHTDPERQVDVYELRIGNRPIRLSAWHLVFAVIVLAALPQILYLLSRNLTLHVGGNSPGFRWHLDTFFSGSGGGNCGLPGNEACKNGLLPVNKVFQPWHAALVWGAFAAGLLWLNRGERRLSRLYFIGAWFFVALAAMGKGAPGLVLPVFIAGAYIAATRRWRDLERVELLSLLLITACVTLPWYVQMFMRHGQPFTDRLLFHDMYKRAFVHVHDTNVGDDTSFRYYVWQLGYGLFPWTGFAVAGLGWWLRRNNDRSDSEGDLGAFLALWFVAAFGMFTITLTKFHHYIFPVVPPTAMLTGLMLDRMIKSDELPTPRKLPPYLAGLGGAALLLVYGASRFYPGAVDGSLGAKPSRVLGYVCVAAGIALAIFVMRAFGRRPAPSAPPSLSSPDAQQAYASSLEPSPVPAGGSGPIAAASTSSADERSYDAIVVGAMAIVAAVVVALAGRDLFTTMKGDIDGQARLMHLFTYNYRRPWPDSLDFDGILKAFTVVSAAICLACALFRQRTHAVVAFLSVSVVWAAWGVNVYLVKASPHWGQRETVYAYYADRKSPDEPFVSYQMNWKGENFYTGNRTPAWVSSGQKFKEWIEEQKKKGVRTMYFTTEHGRESTLKSEIGSFASFEAITKPELNNKFFTARVRF